MEQHKWDQAVATVAKAVPDLFALARCLDVQEHLRTWQDSGDVLPGTIASNALDQALGLLDELAAGEAAGLARVVRSLLDALPPSLD